MKTTHKTILTTLMAGMLVTGMTLAQGPGGRPSHGPPRGGPGGSGTPGGHGGPGGGDEAKPPVPPVVEALDKDQDGSISEDEIKEATESLKGLDENNDGKLTKDELKPERPAGAQGTDEEKKESRRKRHLPPIIKALDTDEDGEISAEEMDGAAGALAELDHNNDGKLSRMEIRPNRRFKPRRNNG